MRIAAAALTVFVVGCTSTSIAARPSPSPTVAASPTIAESPTAAASPSAPASPSVAASPSASPRLGSTFDLPGPVSPPAEPAGSCALPIYWQDGQSPQSAEDAAFMIYPVGDVTYTQTLTGGSSAYYDVAAGRWLPVPAADVSPDGLSFAYADYDLPPPPAAGMAGEERPRAAGVLATTGRVYLIDARTGAVKTLYSGSPTYAIAGFTADGIYLTQVAITMDGQFPSGLFLIGTNGGTPKAVPGGDRSNVDRGGWTVLNGAAWATEYTAGLGGLPPGNELVELDLHTGAATTWLTEPEGTAVGLLGFDAAGHALVAAYPSGYSSTGSPAPTPPSRLLALGAPQQSTVLWQTTDPNAPLPSGPVFDDSHGAWFGSQGAVWLDASGSISELHLALSWYVGIGGVCQ